MQLDRFNAQTFLEAMCFAVFGGFLFYLAVSGKYLSYLAPRLKPYLYFTAITMEIWTLAGVGRLFDPQYKIHTSHCFLLVIPLLLLTLPHNPLRAADFSGNYVAGNGKRMEASGGSSDAADEKTPSGENPSGGLPGLDRNNQTICASDAYFGMWFSEIYLNMEKYEGYTVEMTGFVFKNSDLLEENEFVPARLAMTCCAADLEPVGVTCRYDKASELETGSWVTVKGTLHLKYEKFDGKKYADPLIEVTKISPAEEVEGYVYPY